MIRPGAGAVVGGGLLLVLLRVLLMVATGSARAADDSASDWRFHLDAYSWLTTEHGSVTTGGKTVAVDTDLHDVFDLLGAGDALGGAGHFEAHHVPSRISLFTDAVGSVVDTGASSSLGKAKLDSSLAFIEWGVGYRIWQASFGDQGERTMWLEPFVGGRYTYLGNAISITPNELPTQKAESNVDFVDPFVGGRWALDLPYGFGVTWRADIGGFDTGSKLSWSMVSTVTYALPWTLAGAPLFVGSGYKIISFDYEDGSGDAQRNTDLEFRGPMLGLGAHF